MGIYVLEAGWDYEGFMVLGYVESEAEAKAWVEGFDARENGFQFADYEEVRKLED